MALSTKPWGSFSEGDYTLEQWRRACLIVLGDGSSKDQCKLPIREPSGAVNANGVAAAAAALAGARGGVSAPAPKKRAAARTLLRYYGQMQRDAPPTLRRLAAG